MNLLSGSRTPIDTNTWRTAIGFFWVLVWVHGFFLFGYLRCILYCFLLLITTLFLLFTVYLYDENLGLMAILFLRVNSINVKGNIFSKFSNKCCTYPQVRMFFCSLLQFTPMILLVLFRDIEINPGPEQGYSNNFSFCNWNLNSIAAYSFIKMFLLQAEQLHK